MPHSIERILDKQMRLWQIHRDLLHETADSDPAPVRRPVVTISRQLGSCHGEIARGLAARFGLQVHGRSLIDAVARDKGLERRVVESLDERTRSEVDIWVSGILNRRLFSHDEFHLALVKTVRSLASHGGVIFVGRGANWILEGTECLRIRVIASRETRLRTVMRDLDVDAVEGRRLMDESDHERAAFVRRLFDADWSDPRAYDLVLNTDHVAPARLVDVAAEAVLARGMIGTETEARPEARAWARA